MKKKIFDSIKTGNFFSKIFCYFLILIGFSNDKIMTMQVRNKKYLKLKRKYSKYISNDYKYIATNNKINKIWFCWLQGKENMLPIVKSCYKSIINNCSEFDIIFIDSSNYKDYISLPDYIVDKWKRGLISNAHFSDIIRTCLLCEYGGLWIDATTYLLDKLPDYIFKSNLFMFDMRGEDNIMTYNNWLIYSEKNNRIMKIIRDLLFIFWKKENKVQDYFVWHIFMKLVYDKYTNDFNDMIYIPHSCTHVLFNYLEKNNDVDYNYVKNICPIQKLTYKVKNNSKDTLYNKLLNK